MLVEWPIPHTLSPTKPRVLVGDVDHMSRVVAYLDRKSLGRLQAVSKGVRRATIPELKRREPFYNFNFGHNSEACQLFAEDNYDEDCVAAMIYGMALIKEDAEQRIKDNLDTALLPGGIQLETTSLCSRFAPFNKPFLSGKLELTHIMGGRDVDTLRIFSILWDDCVNSNIDEIRDKVIMTVVSTSFPLRTIRFHFDEAWETFYAFTFTTANTRIRRC
jgi:hypothetical protein